jgi:GAF domain-containing protein/anti-sigma regulatory factor (Ser/Thr protein kinase)
MQCPRCQHKNRSQAKFCDACGAPVARLEAGAQPALSYEEVQRSLSEALDQQTATSEILRVISSAPTDVQPVFETIVKNAARLCDAFDAVIFQVDAGVLRLVAHEGPVSVGPVGQFTVPLVQGVLTGRVALERQAIQVADHQAADDEYHEGNAIARRYGVRTMLGVPLMLASEAVGVIALRRAEVRPFTDRQIALLQTFADQAVIAIENVRLFKELETKNRDLTESLAQQTATGEILEVIAHSPTDIRPVLDTVAESAARLCEASDVAIFRLEGDRLRVAAHHGPIPLQPASDATISLHGTVPGRSVLEARTIHVTDLQEEAAEFPEGSELARRFGFRTSLTVPLIRQAAAVGTITLRRTEARRFSERQVALLQTFADQAVIAIENVRLFTELQEKNRALTQAHAQVTEALEQQTATAEILRVISSSPTDIQPVLEALAESAARLCGSVDASIYRRDGDRLFLVAQVGPIPQGVTGEFFLPLGRGTVVGRSVLDGRTVHVLDLQAMGDEFPEGREHASRLGLATVLAVPLMRAGVGIGSISLRRTEAQLFTLRQAALLEIFANQAVIAIENVRLFTELQEKNRALTDAHAQVTESLEQQTATSEILRVISRSQADVQPVFDTIVQSAARLCHAVNAAVFLTDGRMVHHPANYGSAPEALAVARARYPRPLDMDTMPGMVILTRSVVHVPDIEEPSAVPLVREVGRFLGFRSTVAVPMLREGEAIGSINVARREPGRFSDAEVELLQTFADQAVIAIENVRLFTELQASNRELTTALDTQTATSDILRVISRSQTDVQPVFDAIVDSAARLLRGNASTLSRIEGDQIALAAMTSTDDPGDASQRARFPMSIHSEEDHAQAVRNRAPLHSTDAHSDPRLPETQHASARLRGYRSLVVVPLVHHDEAVGALGVARREPGGFADDEMALLKTFADQAVIAIENVRLFNELEGRNRDLTATAEILRVISSSPTDAQPVFETIVSSAVRLCDGLFSALYKFDGELIHFVAHHNYTPEALEAAHRVFPARPTRALFTGRTILERAVVHISDVEVDPEHQHRVLRRAIGWRSGLFVPMLREGAPIGVIEVARAEPGPFSANEIELLKTFADQAVIAVENVRLFNELQARTGELTQSVEKLTALGEVSRAVSSTLDVETVLDTIVSRASQLAGAAGCSIYEYDEGAEQFELRATHNDDTAFVEALRAARLRKGEGLMGRAAEMRESIQIPDITQPGAYQSGVRDTLIRFGYRALLSVPLLLEDQIIGSLSFNRKTPGEFPPEVVDVLKTFATQSALAIQNARLFREIADKSRQLEAASRHKSEFLANMSHELRTPLNAIIGFSEVLAEKMFGDVNDKQAEYLQDILGSGRHLLSLINDILDLSKIEAGRMELEPAAFDLPSAIENALILVRERASRRGIRLGSTIDTRLGMISGDERKVKQVLLNILSNALKFTPEGGRIDIDARLHADRAEVSVTDTGVGIAPGDQEVVFEEFRQVGTADKKAEGTGLGLALSRKFIELHGGTIWVQSEVGRGSTFTFTLPVRPCPAS